MAITIQTRKGKKKTTHTATVRVPGHNSVSKTFTRKKDAQEWAGDSEKEIKGERYQDPRQLAGVTLGLLLDQYEERVSVKKAATTREREIRTVRSLKLHLGETTPATEITPAVVARFRDARLKGVTAYTVRQEMALLSHMFKIARKEWQIPLLNPMDDIERPPVPQGRTRFLIDAEVNRLLAECKKLRNPMLHPYILCLVHTGMRPSEAAALTWPRVDLKARAITLNETKGGGIRRVPITSTLRDVMAAIQGQGTDDYVFLTGKTDRIQAQTVPALFFRESFEKARAAAGLNDVHLHDLRHTAASHLLMAGVDLRTLAEILGHKTMQMVQRYTHLLDDHKLAAVDKIEGLGMDAG